jgi:hypothetical protein
MVAIIVVTNNIAFYGSYQQINALFSSQLCHYSSTPTPSGISSLAGERSTRRHDRMNTDEADKDAIEREHPSYIYRIQR